MSHSAVVTTGPRAPLELIQIPTPKPQGFKVVVKTEWTSTQPFDLHKADGGLTNPKYPDIMGDGGVGTVVAIGEKVTRHSIGDKVFGFTWKTPEERGHQTYFITSENFLGRLPSNISPPEAATIPTNFVTVFHTVINHLHLPLPYPKPDNWIPESSSSPILIWGGASSLHQFDRPRITSPPRTSKTLGATSVFDYNNPNVLKEIRQQVNQPIPYFFDCIGSVSGSVVPISKLAEKGSRVATLLPVIISPPTPTSTPEYGMDPVNYADWAEGVDATGVRTHAYDDDEFLARCLQPDIMPEFVEKGLVKANKYRVIEGKDMLERAENALTALREGVSGVKLVWKVAEDA